MKTRLAIISTAVILSCMCTFGCQKAQENVATDTPDAVNGTQNNSVNNSNGGEKEENKDNNGNTVSDNNESKDNNGNTEGKENTESAGSSADLPEKAEVFFAEYGITYKQFLCADKESDITIDLVKKSEWEYDYTITIDGKQFNNVVQSPDDPCENYAIFDLDPSDNKRQIALQDRGPSSDYGMTILEYDGNSLYVIGYPEGVFQPGESFVEAVCYAGRISSYVRLDILQTWFARADYVLKNGKLVLDVQDYYEAISPVENITVLEDFTVYLTPDKSSETAVLSKGTVISTVGTDNIEWVKAVTQDEKEYWLLIAEDGHSLIDGDNTVFASELLSGLCYAD